MIILLDFSNFDTGKIIDARNIFFNCNSLINKKFNKYFS